MEPRKTMRELINDFVGDNSWEDETEILELEKEGFKREWLDYAPKRLIKSEKHKGWLLELPVGHYFFCDEDSGYSEQDPNDFIDKYSEWEKTYPDGDATKCVECGSELTDYLRMVSFVSMKKTEPVTGWKDGFPVVDEKESDYEDEDYVGIPSIFECGYCGEEYSLKEVEAAFNA